MERAANDVEYRLIELGRRYSLDTADGRVLYLKRGSGATGRFVQPYRAGCLRGKAGTGAVGFQGGAVVSGGEPSPAAGEKATGTSAVPNCPAVGRVQRRINPEAQKHPRAVSAGGRPCWAC